MTIVESQVLPEAGAIDRRPGDDALLLQILAGGDTTPLETLYDLYGSRCFGLALRLLAGDHGAAEDVVQDVFVRLWRSAGSYDAERASVLSWLLRITRHACIDVMRRQSARPQSAGATQLPAVPARDDVWSDVAQRLTGEQVRAALESLPTKQKHVIHLAYFEGLTCDEMAQRTGAPLGTVKGRLRLGLHKLRAVVELQSAGN